MGMADVLVPAAMAFVTLSVLMLYLPSTMHMVSISSSAQSNRRIVLNGNWHERKNQTTNHLSLYLLIYDVTVTNELL